MEVFFVTACQTHFEIDFSDVSLANLVKHTRTKNWLKKTEEHLSNSDRLGATESIAVAFGIYRRFLNEAYRDEFRILSKSIDDRTKVLQEMYQDILKHDELLWLLQYGVDLADYRRFNRLTPNITFFQAGNYESFGTGRRTVPNENDAGFCYKFVVETILMIQEKDNPQYAPPRGRFRVDQEVTINKACPLFVDRKEMELLKEVSVGEKFDSICTVSQEDYVRVYYQGARAYIKKENVVVEPIDMPSETTL